MLEKKSEKISYFDAHFHFSDCIENNCFDSTDDILGISCFHSKEEWDKSFQVENNWKGFRAFGLHPLNPEINLFPFLESLSDEKKINAIGECGFDFFKDEYKSDFVRQNDAFRLQLELAQKKNLPLIIHSRKANEKIFEYSSELKKLPSVLFHSFMGSFTEAKALKNRGINAYFSFGKQIVNGNKKVIECVKNIPHECLLLETDVPYQYLKGEEKTYSSEIKKIYEGAFNIREDIQDYSEFSDILRKNFTACFGNL